MAAGRLAPVTAAPSGGHILRRRPPAAALQWAAENVGPGCRITSVRALESSWLANHALDVVDATGRLHRVVLRRWARPGWDRDDPDFTAAREARLLRLLAGSCVAVPVPRLLAADPDGRVCDVPALLLSRLPGHPPRADADVHGLLAQLADALPAIHAVDGSAGTLVPAYRRYYEPDRLRPPGQSRRRGLWQQAIEVVSAPAPAFSPCLIHRDYHPGNTLWSRGRLAGVVDWTAGSWGPAALDVAHMRWNLAVDYGLAAAEEFLRRWQVTAGAQGVHHPYWDLVAILDLGTGLGSGGPEHLALEAHLAACMARL